jgi:putative nucleotidyltransferase with HDIG domain
VGASWKGEGWWRAPDGKWYPPGQPVEAPSAPAPPPSPFAAPIVPKFSVPRPETAARRKAAPGSLQASAPVTLAAPRATLAGESIVVGSKEAADAAADRWHGRPVLAALVSASVFIVPISLSILAATVTGHVLPRPRTDGALAAWWIVVLGVPSVVLVVTDRLARRALPLAVLLKMTMVFPDQAPKRRAVVRKSGSTRNLAQRVEEARTHGIEDEPVVAAEKILALAGALNAHDRLTRGHGERVRVLTDLIADELDLSTHDRDRLRWSALLHDIGKLAVHPHILNKPDKLDDEEWEIIKNHPLEGAKLTAPLASWLGEWANTIAEHHERFDGKGYPYGLKGDEISFGGRIVAVADCYDTMTTARSYKTSMTPNAARAELAACSGTQFDPRVVRAFLDVSIVRLRPMVGPLAWLGSLPFIGSIPQLGQATVAVLGRVGAASLVVSGAVAVGTVKAIPTTPAPAIPSQVALPSSEAPVGAVSVDPRRAGSSAGSPRSLILGPDTSSTTTAAGSGISGTDSGTTTTLGGVPATAPSSVTGVTATGGNGVATVSWSAPPDGGSPITSYTVTRYLGGVVQAQDTVASSVTSRVDTGLSNGTTYTFTVTAINAIGAGLPSGPSPQVTPLAPSLSLTNGGTLAGRAQKGDQIVVTFSPAPSPSSLCAAWSTTSYPDLDDSNAVVSGTEGSSGDDSISVTDTADCSGGFHFGTIDLGQAGYFNSNVSFGGSVSGCKNGKTTGCSTIHWDGQNTLTITLGTVSSAQFTQTKPSVAVYYPAASLGLTGTISSAKEENF